MKLSLIGDNDQPQFHELQRKGHLPYLVVGTDLLKMKKTKPKVFGLLIATKLFLLILNTQHLDQVTCLIFSHASKTLTVMSFSTRINVSS